MQHRVYVPSTTSCVDYGRGHTLTSGTSNSAGEIASGPRRNLNWCKGQRPAHGPSRAPSAPSRLARQVAPKRFSQLEPATATYLVRGVRARGPAPCDLGGLLATGRSDRDGPRYSRSALGGERQTRKSNHRTTAQIRLSAEEANLRPFCPPPPPPGFCHTGSRYASLYSKQEVTRLLLHGTHLTGACGFHGNENSGGFRGNENRRRVLVETRLFPCFTEGNMFFTCSNRNHQRTRTSLVPVVLLGTSESDVLRRSAAGHTLFKGT